MNPNWYLIQAKTRQESVAESSLTQLGVETVCPRFVPSHRTRGKNQVEEKKPLFPGYLFTKMDISNDFRKVSYAHGVLGVVKFGGAPTVVEDEIIQAIRARVYHGLIVFSSSSPLKSGQVVRIVQGPFCGFEGIFQEKLNGIERVALLLKTVSYHGRIVVDRNALAV